MSTFSLQLLSKQVLENNKRLKYITNHYDHKYGGFWKLNKINLKWSKKKKTILKALSLQCVLSHL